MDSMTEVAVRSYEGHSLGYTLCVDPLARSLSQLWPSVTLANPNDASPSVSSFKSWLLKEPLSERHVAFYERVPVGHIQMSFPSPFLDVVLVEKSLVPSGAWGFVEISKFFVDRSFWGRRIGSDLFASARTAAWALGFQPVVMVDDCDLLGSFYYRHGFESRAMFDGPLARQHVLIDPSLVYG